MKYKPKALVVEDTKHWQDIFAESLASLDCRIQIASSYEDVTHILSRQSFDVAILDISLSEGNSRNTDGMKILKDIRDSKDRTSIIIVSGYATVGIAIDAFEKYQVLGFIEKGQNFDEEKFIKLTKQGIQEAQEKGFGVKSLIKALLVETGLTYDQIRSIRGSDQDLEGLLQNIFADSWPFSENSMVSSKLIETAKGEHIGEIAGWSKGIGESIVVRLGAEKIIKKESKNYSGQKLGSLINSSKKEPVYKTGLGGIVYVLTNAPFERLRSFGSFYKDEGVSRIIQVLHNLFWKSCNALYFSSEVDRAKVDLSSMYRTVTEQIIVNKEKEYKNDLYDLSQLEDADHQDYLRTESQKNEATFNLVEFIQKQSFIFESPVGVTHGDLQSENIMVDSELQTWLLGFYDTGASDVLLTKSDKSDSVVVRAYQAGKRNLLHDFATVEVSIRKTLNTVGHEEMQAFDRALCNTKQLDKLTQVTFDSPELDKAYKVIVGLRELALEILADYELDVRLYYSELLFQFLEMYLHIPDQVAKNQVWATASILAEKLSRPD